MRSVCAAASPSVTHTSGYSAGESESHAEEPVAEQLTAAQRRGFAGQYNEHRLKHVVSRVVIADDPSADATDQRPVPVEQGRERSFVAICRESLQ